MRELRRDTNVCFVIVGMARREIMANRQSIGRSFADPVNCDGSADELSVDPASDGSRLNHLIEILMRPKRRAFPTSNGT